LRYVPGLDDDDDVKVVVVDGNSSSDVDNDGERRHGDDGTTDHNQWRNVSRRWTQHHLGKNATNSAFLNSSEPGPNIKDCLVSHKLQVFYITLECFKSRYSEKICWSVII